MKLVYPKIKGIFFNDIRKKTTKFLVVYIRQ